MIEEINMKQFISFSCPPKGKGHKKKSHYEGNYIPLALGDIVKYPPKKMFKPSIHKTGFSPSVYRHETPNEIDVNGPVAYSRLKNPWSGLPEYLTYRASLSNMGGYRNLDCVVGLLNTGYIDLDAVEVRSEYPGGVVPHVPTVENIANMLRDKNMWFYVHPSASRSEGKLRVLYRRNLTVFMDDNYDPLTYKWDLMCSDVSTVKAVTDEGVGVPIANSLVDVIEHILTCEMATFKGLMEEAGLDSSGLDFTSLHPHMHSKHLTNNNDVRGCEEWEMASSDKPLVDWGQNV